MNQEAIYHGIVNIVGDAISLLQQVAGADFANKVQITWNKRMRSTAGRAFLIENRVELNPRLLHLDNNLEQSLAQVKQTLLHELAHLLAHHRHGLGIQPHGREWQHACTELGIPGESATHTLNLPSRRQKKKWSYTCPHCLSVIERVKRMRSQAACYPCCKAHNKGKFHRKFALIEDKIEDTA